MTAMGRRTETAPLRNRTERRTVERHLVGYPEAAAHMGTTERHVRRLWAERKLPAYKVGALVRFDLDDLDRYLADRRVEAVR